jgi:hypothetical protein
MPSQEAVVAGHGNKDDRAYNPLFRPPMCTQWRAQASVSVSSELLAHWGERVGLQKSSGLDSNRRPGRGELRQTVAAVLLPLLGIAALDAPAFASGAGVAPRPAAIRCTASVTSRYPARGSRIGILIKTVPAAHIRTTAHFKSARRIERSRADSAGRQTIWYRVGTATPGYRVVVDVLVYGGRTSGSCSTWFAPRRPHRHGRAAAWCTATASVYNAEYDWNNVYVHSNRPHTDATAAADGYSWSYETDGSGYAEIYLNGPPAGARITVTVGRATCHTSD